LARTLLLIRPEEDMAVTKGRLSAIACGLGLVVALALTQTRPATAALDPARFDSIESAMDSAIGAFTASAGDLGSKADQFVNNFNQAKTNVQTAQDEDASGDRKRAVSQVKKAIRKVIGVGFKLRNLRARKTIPSETRTMLLDLVNPILQDLKQLKKDL
jgi:hypothetical protein